MDIKDLNDVVDGIVGGILLKEEVAGETMDLEFPVGYGMRCHELALLFVKGNPFVTRAVVEELAYSISNLSLLAVQSAPQDKEGATIKFQSFIKQAIGGITQSESPLEHALFLGIIADDPTCLIEGLRSPIVQQHRVGPYRVDFAIPSKRIVIETDGHTYHEKTVEQAVSDRARDRFMVNEGWKVYRYHRADIESDLLKVAHEVNEMNNGDGSLTNTAMPHFTMATESLKTAAAKIEAAKSHELPAVVADAMHSVLAGDRSEKKAACKMDRVVEERFFVEAPKEIHTGLPRFDRLAGSMLPGLIVVAGSSGCGKSALLSTMALRMAQSEEKLAVLYFTFDARRQEVADSMIYSVARVDQDARDYTLSTDEAKRVDDAQALVTRLPIWIDDRRALTIEQIESSILAIQGDAKRMDRTLVVVLDSIQHVKVERGEQDAALQLADVGQRCNVSIIGTSGLIERYKPKKSVEHETLGTDGPQLADVPGPVSAAASRVILIYNYAAMHRAEVFFDESAPPVESDRVVLIVAKNKRRGGVGRVEVTFTPLYGLFEDKLHTRTESTDTDTYSGSDPGEDVPFDD